MEPEGEQGDHPCPKCGYEWWDVEKETEEEESDD